MPARNEPIPVLSGHKMDQFHFDSSLRSIYVQGRTDLFHINKVEDLKDDFKFPLPPHRKTVFDFLFLTRGSSIRSKGLDKYEFGENTFFFLPAYQISSHEHYSEDAQGYYCHFDFDILTRELLLPGFLNQFPFLQFMGEPIVKVDQQTADTTIFILRSLEQKHLSYKPNYSLISAYLSTLFLEIKSFATTFDKVTENAALRITQQYKNALVQHINKKQSVGDYAVLLSVTADYLNKCVKATTGKAAHDLLVDMVLMEAKALLRQTSLSISEIAFKIGKEDPSDFTRFFRSKTGFTPSQFRQLS